MIDDEDTDDDESEEDGDARFEAWWAEAENAPLTPEEAAEAAELDHIPNRAETRALLEKYFVGPISEEFVDYVEEACRRNHDEFGGWRSILDAHESMYMGRGMAWREEQTRTRLVPKIKLPRPIDEVVLVAHGAWFAGKGTPRPRPFCPPEFIGRWQQIEPNRDPPRYWEFLADGSFHSDSEDTPPDCTRWRVWREFEDHLYKLTIDDDREQGGWSLSEVELPRDEIKGVHLGAFENTDFRLRKVSG